MVEQKPEIKIDPEGYSDRGAGVLGQTNRKLGRLGSFLRKHPTAQKIAAVGAFVGLGGIAVAEVAGCGPGKTENTTNPPGATSTQVPGTESSSTTIPYATTEGNNTTTNTIHKTTTITEAPTTTTTEAPITTTTETTLKSFDSLINHDITMQDVRASKITFGDFSIADKPPVNVSDKLQQEMIKKNGIRLLYVGSHNRAEDPNSLEGNQLNNVLFYPEPNNITSSYNGFITVFGGIGQFDQETWFKMGQELADKPIVPIPNSKDFYAYDQVRKIFVRIVRETNGKYEQALLNYFDLNNTGQLDNGIAPEDGQQPTELYTNREKHMAGNLSEDSLAIFFDPGSTMGYYMQEYPKLPGTKGIVDENGIPVARLAFRVGYDGINMIKNF